MVELSHPYMTTRKTLALTRQTLGPGYLERLTMYRRTVFHYKHKFEEGNSGGLKNAVQLLETSLVAQMVKRLSAMQKTQVHSLGWEDPLEKEMATHSSTLAWKIPWTEEPDRLQSMGLQSQTRLSDFTSLLQE